MVSSARFESKDVIPYEVIVLFFFTSSLLHVLPSDAPPAAPAYSIRHQYNVVEAFIVVEVGVSIGWLLHDDVLFRSLRQFWLFHLELNLAATCSSVLEQRSTSFL